MELYFLELVPFLQESCSSNLKLYMGVCGWFFYEYFFWYEIWLHTKKFHKRPEGANHEFVVVVFRLYFYCLGGTVRSPTSSVDYV